MTGAAQVLNVRRVDDDLTSCRRCNQPIQRGRRVALVTGTGNVCLRCLLRHDQADDEPETT